MKRLTVVKRLLCLWLCLALLGVARAQDPTPTPDWLALEYPRSDRFGITFISSAQAPANDERYRHALELGAGWNRFPIYWEMVETRRNRYDWANYDRVVREDVEHGFRINAILLGIPSFYRVGESINNLSESIFTDGTDTYGRNKTINPDNPWALWVYDVVSRYRPGGYLAQQLGWRAGQGIRVWEIWNEPDFPPFWSASVPEYARLLKVAYIVAHVADPQAEVMFGGLLFNDPEGDNWLAQVLAIYLNDPAREDNNWYMDAVAVHSYDYAWRSGWLVRVVTSTLSEYGLQRPVWLNESGAPVWDDYPGPTWIDDPAEQPMRLTMAKQAQFFLQSTSNAFAEGAQGVFFHQLYDDCGNQAPGTNFPPTDTTQIADAFGIFRNESDALCFSQHPQAGTPRPVANAYRLLTTLFGTQDFVYDPIPLVFPPTPIAPTAAPDATAAPAPTVTRAWRDPEAPITINDALIEDRATIYRFMRTQTNEVIYVLWNQTLREFKVAIPADGAATLYTLDGDRGSSMSNQALTAEPRGREQVYNVTLPAAERDPYPFLNAGDLGAVDGDALFIVMAGE
jgi:hypothetical protein